LSLKVEFPLRLDKLMHIGMQRVKERRKEPCKTLETKLSVVLKEKNHNLIPQVVVDITSTSYHLDLLTDLELESEKIVNCAI
jgi:hypothetical protein